MKPIFFRSPAEFRRWLAANHAKESELLVGFHRKESGRPSMTWPESVDEALCVGWIDGVRKRRDDSSYTIRFTPRKSVSTWSAININRMKVLITEGRVQPAGKAAFERRIEKRSVIYSYEQRSVELNEPYASMLRKNRRAAAYFEKQPPSYRKLVCWWVNTAKQEATRQKRIQKLIEFSAAGRRI
jgi:uncharacterized protein YdeI (YjbR/CyaY-like superfamily)